MNKAKRAFLRTLGTIFWLGYLFTLTLPTDGLLEFGVSSRVIGLTQWLAIIFGAAAIMASFDRQDRGTQNADRH
ncbi:hypothetical protein [Rubrivivax gelatinosus]|uniref:hypothetical protein n=1 Tax=Rubrivivax gelatinosus TaxID=28068 RepID=UPI0005C201ED|nr:hypothetical protein [Rubrivivax gelatinosus]MBG6083023.1 hypothetical protein [Rubrivivax gelatinosus]